MFLPMFGGLFLTEPLFKATWALCVYPEECVQRRRTATDVILSPPCFARWHAHAGTDVPVCTAVCQCEEGKHKQKSLSSVLCLEAFLLSGWVSFDLLDMMMGKKKKGKKNRFVGSWNAASAFPQLFRNLFFFGVNGGGKKGVDVQTCTSRKDCFHSTGIMTCSNMCYSSHLISRMMGCKMEKRQLRVRLVAVCVMLRWHAR